MRVLIVGAGSIGTRHAVLLHRMVAPEILVADPDDARRAAFLQAVPARAVASLDLGLAERPDATIVCSPTSLHIAQCLQAVRANSHVLLEKPVSHTLDGVEQLFDEAHWRKRVVLVACNFRFDPALSQMKEWLKSGVIGKPLTCRATYGQDLRQCRPGRDYREIYTSKRALGGGVLLDSVHEIDYLSWFFGPAESVSAMTDKLSDLEVDTEDSANLLLRFRAGTRALVQLDYFRPEYNRSCEIIGTEGILQWSYSPKLLRYFSSRSGLWSTRAMDDDAATDVMYSRQLQHFLDCVAGLAEPVQGIRAAANTLHIALCAARSAAEGREVAIPATTAGSDPAGTMEKPVRQVPYAKVVTIIQARLNSTRLPGKVLADVSGKPMLVRVIERVKKAEGTGEIVVATSDAPVDDPIAAVCASMGIGCYRGSQLDVLDRYYRCARLFSADLVVRITGDCPLIDPRLIDEVIRTFHEAGVDYASNRRFGSPRPLHSFPDGLDVEVFSFAALHSAHANAGSAYDREHVTPFIWRNFSRFRLLFVQSTREFLQRSWTVDYPEDLEFVRTIFERMGNGAFGFEAVVKLLEEDPAIAKSNGHVGPNGDWRYASREVGPPPPDGRLGELIECTEM